MIQANSLNIPLKDESVQCVVTSPAYWGLRDYGTATWEGGKHVCDHVERNNRNDGGRQNSDSFAGNANKEGHADMGVRQYSKICQKCGAKRIDNQLGLEKTPEEYVENTVKWAREVWRVLRKDGTFWLNLGDSYVSSPTGNMENTYKFRNSETYNRGNGTGKVDGLKPKDLCEIPSDVVRALRADGWWLRSRMPWVKRSAMPESCTDRPASALEYMFLLTKSQKYYFDMDAIRKKSVDQDATFRRYDNGNFQKVRGNLEPTLNADYRNMKSGRNFRNTDLFYQSLEEPHGAILCGDEMVGLDVNPQAYSEAHFATFPEWLVTPLIKAGTSEKGACPECGAPWERVVEKVEGIVNPNYSNTTSGKMRDDSALHGGTDGSTLNWTPGKSKTIGWEPTCGCRCEKETDDGESYTDWIDPVPCIVLDPFGGSGTTKNVADRLGRRGVICELKMEYIEMANKRCYQEPSLFFNGVGT